MRARKPRHKPSTSRSSLMSSRTSFNRAVKASRLSSQAFRGAERPKNAKRLVPRALAKTLGLRQTRLTTSQPGAYRVLGNRRGNRILPGQAVSYCSSILQEPGQPGFNGSTALRSRRQLEFQTTDKGGLLLPICGYMRPLLGSTSGCKLEAATRPGLTQTGPSATSNSFCTCEA